MSDIQSKTTRHAEKQENPILNEMEYRLVEPKIRDRRRGQAKKANLKGHIP